MGCRASAWLAILRWFRTYRDEDLTWRESFNRRFVCRFQGHRFGKRSQLGAHKNNPERTDLEDPGEREPKTPAEMAEGDDDLRRRVHARCEACRLNVVVSPARVDEIETTGQEPWTMGSRRIRYRDSPESLAYELEALKQRVEALRRSRR